MNGGLSPIALTSAKGKRRLSREVIVIAVRYRQTRTIARVLGIPRCDDNNFTGEASFALA